METQRAAPCPPTGPIHAWLLAAVSITLTFALGVVTARLTDVTARLPNEAATVDARRGLPATTPALSGISEGAEPLSGIPAMVRRLRSSVVTVLAGDSQGSGVVWSAEGIIVTVSHVLPVDGPVEVVFADGDRVPGIVLARDVGTDLAIIEVHRTNLQPAAFRAEPVQVGELVITLGSPFGLENTVTAGIISAEQRAIWVDLPDPTLLEGLLQTDAAISKGDSGGALVDAAGEVVGINQAYIPPSEGAVAIAFAIPSSVVATVVKSLLMG